MSITIGIQAKTPFAKESEVRAGQYLTCDDRFTCVEAGARLRIKEDGNGFYFKCAEGKHYLDGQVDDSGMLIGLAFRSAK